MFILRTYQWNYYWRNLILIVLIRLLDDAKKYLSLFSFYNKLWNFIYLLGHQKKIVFEDKKYFSSTYKKNNLSYGLKYVSKKTSAAPAWAGISLDRMERIYSYSSWK